MKRTITLHSAKTKAKYQQWNTSTKIPEIMEKSERILDKKVEL